METGIMTSVLVQAGELILFITFLASAYQKLTEKIIDKLGVRLKAKLDPVFLCFILSFVTCLSWRIGALSLFRPTQFVFDALITSLFMTFEAGALNDLVGIMRGRKEALQVKV